MFIIFRLEALRQEVMESPGKNMTITMISPTQVVLGRSTPYFVPSGERAQGPIINQNATPEHVPEPDKVNTILFHCFLTNFSLTNDISNNFSWRGD